MAKTVINLPYGDNNQFLSSSTANAGEPIIFHYTRAAGALGIMQSGEMWCTLASHMNDRVEGKYAHSLARSIAYSELQKSTDSLRSSFMNEFTEQLARYQHRMVYAACFSEAEDLLSQWRGYTGKFGYALGFSLKSLQTVAAQQHFLLQPVKYQFAEQRDMLRPIVLDLISKYNPDLDHDEHREQIDEVFAPAMKSISEKSAVIKHPSFSEEREWRLHSHPLSLLQDRTDFVVRDDQIVPIVKLKLDNGTSKHRNTFIEQRDICLRSCVIGPGPDPRERLDAMWAVSTRYGVRLDQLIESAAPLR
ncbi:DUF2971 domain-containing protein [Bradyrhizobium sp. CCBAU 25338]|uniref:DUF2971 domain-containing protein n=1 Tax=Bradyrhizobium sp. CCBAU 25338 TaxID=1641877 RepID=UPI0023032787|nr:DUF2971 domain-containing protein [Bradyrhizobium sp. CCBAU 25338]MDA9529432.1 hypothetical protein [Bradyrhizobium sp. CCBAU 25338]